MKKAICIFSLLVMTLCSYGQNYKIKDKAIVKLDENGKVIKSKSYNKSGVYLKDFAHSNELIVVAINYDDYSELEILNTELIFQNEKTINSSSNIKAIAINNKNEIVILFSNGTVEIFNSKLDKVSKL